MNFYYCIFSVTCLEEEKKMPKMAKNGQKWPKKNQLKKRWKSPDPPPPRWKISIFSYLKASLILVTNSYIQNIKSLAVNRSIPLLGSVCIISCLPCLHENFQKKLSSVDMHCWVGCPNILNFSTFYILHCKIYIIKWHENWQKIIIFRKMGITFDWDVLSS